jgi:rod shape determining protein RodA
MSRSSFTAAELYAGTSAPSRSRLRLATPAWFAVAAALYLSILGIVSIGTTEPALATRQAIFLAVGIAAAALATVVPPQGLRAASWFLLALSLALLVFVLLPFVPKSIVTPRNGARAWINLGVVDFQPSELAKIAYILCLAQWLSLRGSPRTLRSLLVPVLLLLVPVGLIFLEPDLGSALLFFPTLVAILVAAGARWRHILVSAAIAVSAVPIAYAYGLQPYQRARIDAIVAQVKGDTRFERDIGLQGWRAMRLTGAGGVTGNGEDHARALVVFNALPEEHNDMIFAVVGCRFGVIGGISVLAASTVYLMASLAVAMQRRDGFSKLVAVGIGALLFSQMAVNVGMTIGLLPITGVTLPFVSYGGSSLTASWALTGILLAIGLRPPLSGDKNPFESKDPFEGKSPFDDKRAFE